MKLKITQININWANKEGQAYLDKFQKPYARVGIKTEQHGQRWLSGFAYTGSPALSLKIGDEIEAEIEEKGQYLNFRLPKSQNGGDVMKKLSELEGYIKEIHKAVMNLVVEPSEPDGGVDGNDAAPDDIPGLDF